MASRTTQPELFESEPVAANKVGIVVVNERCRIQTVGGYRVVSACGIAMAHYAVGDRAGEAHAMVSLVDLGCTRPANRIRAR
jgi:hypothetical protein